MITLSIQSSSLFLKQSKKRKDSKAKEDAPVEQAKGPPSPPSTTLATLTLADSPAGESNIIEVHRTWRPLTRAGANRIYRFKFRTFSIFYHVESIRTDDNSIIEAPATPPRFDHQPIIYSPQSNLDAPLHKRARVGFILHPRIADF